MTTRPDLRARKALLAAGLAPWALAAALAAGCSSNADQFLADLKSDNPMVRLSAAIQARNESDPRLVDALTEASQDSNSDIRARAVESLGIIADKKSVPALIRALRDSDPDVRREAVEALGKIKDPTSARPLMALLQTEPKPYDVVWALGQIGDRAAIPLLTPMLESPDPYLAYNASQALRRLR